LPRAAQKIMGMTGGVRKRRRGERVMTGKKKSGMYVHAPKSRLKKMDSTGRNIPTPRGEAGSGSGSSMTKIGSIRGINQKLQITRRNRVLIVGRGFRQSAEGKPRSKKKGRDLLSQTGDPPVLTKEYPVHRCFVTHPDKAQAEANKERNVWIPRGVRGKQKGEAHKPCPG